MKNQITRRSKLHGSTLLVTEHVLNYCKSNLYSKFKSYAKCWPFVQASVLYRKPLCSFAICTALCSFRNYNDMIYAVIVELLQMVVLSLINAGMHKTLGTLHAIIGSGNGLPPVRRQAITWTNAGLLSIGLLGTKSEFCHFYSRKFTWKCHLPKWRPFCPGEDELTLYAFIEPQTSDQGNNKKLTLYMLNYVVQTIWYI